MDFGVLSIAVDNLHRMLTEKQMVSLPQQLLLFVRNDRLVLS
jgi:hypothetical protein